MKKIISIITIITLSGMLLAQKFAFVDTGYILNNIPIYETAKTQLDEFSKNLKEEIDVLKNNIDKLYKDYQSERVLLTEELRLKREEEIMKKEKEMRDLQQKYFGKDGLVFKKREELIKPIQDDIYNAIKEIAHEGSFDVIFDTSENLQMIYTDPRKDKSDDVLKKMGYKNK